MATKNFRTTAEVRAVFDPWHVPPQPLPSPRAGLGAWRPRTLYRLVTDFYRDPLGWLALAVSAFVLVYLGGAAMFWFHSIYLGEGGPAISPVLHWFVDSTAGFIALTPALAIILPITARQVRPHQGATLRSVRYAILGGTLFALVTAPGPVLHDNFVGRGTWFADRITALWGDGRPLPPMHHLPPPTDMSLQVAFGIPVYIGLMWITAVCVRALVRGWRSASQTGAG